MINMKVLPLCPYIIQQTGIKNTQTHQVEDFILILHQITRKCVAARGEN